MCSIQYLFQNVKREKQYIIPDKIIWPSIKYLLWLLLKKSIMIILQIDIIAGPSFSLSASLQKKNISSVALDVMQML
jgi:hypothetical protein